MRTTNLNGIVVLNQHQRLQPCLLALFTQIVATATNKMHEIQDLVSIAANGSVGCMHMALTWLMGVTQQTDHRGDQSLVQRVVSVTNKGLNFVVNVSEALVDGKLPSIGDDKGLWLYVKFMM